jgi:hypothetical protein
LLRAWQLDRIASFSPDLILGDLNCVGTEAAPHLPGFIQLTPESGQGDQIWARSGYGWEVSTGAASDHNFLMAASL